MAALLRLAAYAGTIWFRRPRCNVCKFMRTPFETMLVLAFAKYKRFTRMQPPSLKSPQHFPLWLRRSTSSIGIVLGRKALANFMKAFWKKTRTKRNRERDSTLLLDH